MLLRTAYIPEASAFYQYISLNAYNTVCDDIAVYPSLAAGGLDGMFLQQVQAIDDLP